MFQKLISYNYPDPDPQSSNVTSAAHQPEQEIAENEHNDTNTEKTAHK